MNGPVGPADEPRAVMSRRAVGLRVLAAVVALVAGAAAIVIAIELVRSTIS